MAFIQPIKINPMLETEDEIIEIQNTDVYINGEKVLYITDIELVYDYLQGRFRMDITADRLMWNLRS